MTRVTVSRLDSGTTADFCWPCWALGSQRQVRAKQSGTSKSSSCPFLDSEVTFSPPTENSNGKGGECHDGAKTICSYSNCR